MKLNRYACALSACAALAAAGPIAAQTSAGVTFDMTFTTSDSGNAPLSEQRGRGWMTRDRARIDMSGAPMLGRGTDTGSVSIIVEAGASGARSTAILNHAERQIVRPERMMEEMNQMMQALPVMPQMNLEVKRFVVDTLGAGETIDGFATTRYRVRMELAMRVAVMGESQEMSMAVDETGDYITEFRDFVDAMQDVAPMRSLTQMFGSSPELNAQLERIVAQTPKGLQARADARMTMSNFLLGGEHVVVHSVRMSSIRRAEIPNSVFAIPAGYTELEMPKPGGGR